MDFCWYYGESENMNEAVQLRLAVFVQEQGFAYNAERDGLDDVGWHVIGYDNGKAVCTARLVPEKETTWHVGRIAVAKNLRGKGIGKAMMQEVFAKCKQLQIATVTLASQYDKKGFYTAVGFVPTGEKYILENVAHIDMEYKL